MLETKVKAGQITNLTDARYFAAWEVNWLSFNLNSEEDTYIKPTLVKAIKEWVEGPKIIGEVGVEDAEGIINAVKVLELDGVQIAHNYDIEELKKLNGIEVIQEVIIEKNTTIEELKKHLASVAPYVATFVLDFSTHEISFDLLSKNIPFSIESLKDICSEYPCLLAIHTAPDQVKEVLAAVAPLGLHVVGDEEEKVGFKSFDELDEIFEVLLIEE